MHYKYRWCYAVMLFVSLLVTGYHYDLGQRISHLHALHQEGVRMAQQMQRLQQPRKRKAAKKLQLHQQEEVEILPAILMLAHLHGLQVMSLTLRPAQAGSAFRMESAHLVAEADYRQVSALITALQLQNNLLVMTNFSFKLNAKHHFCWKWIC